MTRTTDAGDLMERFLGMQIVAVDVTPTPQMVVVTLRPVGHGLASGNRYVAIVGTFDLGVDVYELDAADRIIINIRNRKAEP